MYKRQIISWVKLALFTAIRILWGSAVTCMEVLMMQPLSFSPSRAVRTNRPVSYTHLDVYKRQGLGSVVLGIFDEKKLAELLELPEGMGCLLYTSSRPRSRGRFFILP